MKEKKIVSGVIARKKVMEGVDFLADMVVPTMGPHGTNVLTEKGTKVTNDGKSIATEILHDDELSEMAIRVAREASIKTEKEAKDASTTTIALTRAILKEAYKQLPTENMPIGKMTSAEVGRKIEQERLHVEELLDSMSSPISTVEELIDVATVSTEDRELGKLIAETQYDLEDGFLIAEEDISGKCFAEKVRGIVLDNGLASTQVITNQEKQALEVSDCKVILTSNTVKDLKPIESVLIGLSQSGVSKIVIMARAFTEDAIRQCMAYHQAGFQIFPVNAPYTDQNEIMTDLEAVLGGKYVNFEAGPLESITLNDVGFAESVQVERWRSVFAGKDDEASQARVAKRIEELETKLKGTVSMFEKETITKRLAQLRTGFAIIHVGALTDARRKYLKDKADDAVGTVRMAMLDGVVKGGGQAFNEIADQLPDTYILKEPLRCIYKQIMYSTPKGFVIEDWVKDPTLTLKIALKYACEVAANLATVSGIIVTKKQKPRLVEEVNQTEEENG